MHSSLHVSPHYFDAETQAYLGPPRSAPVGSSSPVGAQPSGDKTGFCCYCVTFVTPFTPWPSCLVCTISGCIPSRHTLSLSISTSPRPYSLAFCCQTRTSPQPPGTALTGCSAVPQSLPRTDASTSSSLAPAQPRLVPTPPKSTKLKTEKMAAERTLNPTCKAFG